MSKESVILSYKVDSTVYEKIKSAVLKIYPMPVNQEDLTPLHTPEEWVDIQVSNFLLSLVFRDIEEEVRQTLDISLKQAKERIADESITRVSLEDNLKG